MIKHFIFDIGNVIVDFDPIPYFEKLLPGKHMELVCGLVFDEDWARLDEGVYTGDEVREIQLKKYPEYQEQINCIHDHWMQMMKLKVETISFMKEVKKKGYTTYLLSNIGKESHTYLQKTYGFFDLVDGMVLSYQERLLKPDKRIYECLIDRYQLSPQECVFFDDKEENVRIAKELGIHGIVFQTIAQAKKEVENVIHQ